MSNMVDATLLESALAGDSPALAAVVDGWTPIVQARVVRVLSRRGYRNSPRIRQEIEDFVQEVFVALFENEARALRSWKPTGGLSLNNWVGLIAERQVLTILRTGKRNPWTEEPTPIETLDMPTQSRDPQAVAIASDKFGRLLERLQEELSPLGWTLFTKLYVEEASVDTVVEAFEMTADAVYAWRSRLRRTARRLERDLMSEERTSDRIAFGGELQ